MQKTNKQTEKLGFYDITQDVIEATALQNSWASLFKLSNGGQSFNGFQPVFPGSVRFAIMNSLKSGWMHEKG